MGKQDVTAHFLRGSSPPCLPDQRRKFNGPPTERDDSKDRPQDSSNHTPKRTQQNVLLAEGIKVFLDLMVDMKRAVRAKNFLSFLYTSWDKQDDYSQICISAP